ncbi:MAG: hypothetical protein PF637_14250 [Spirochaetes bacterium]|jgi:hypothetical protein|nr:hypothetical protein [Spirochaetota bacterium]
MKQLQNAVRTTYLIRADRYNRILSIMKDQRIKLSDLIKPALMKTVNKLSSEKLINYGTTQYQPDADEWITKEISFSHPEFNAIVCLKALCRFSLGLIIAMAIDNYILGEPKEVEHSYGIYSFTTSVDIVDGKPLCLFYWGTMRKKREKT